MQMSDIASKICIVTKTETSHAWKIDFYDYLRSKPLSYYLKVTVLPKKKVQVSREMQIKDIDINNGIIEVS